MSLHLGIDTSNYTTSVAFVDEKGQVVADKRRILPVKEGFVGLRQSEALFEHIKAFHNLYSEALDALDSADIKSVSVSYAPRNIEDSYMPVFLAGLNFAKVIATTLGVKLNQFSHQEGHIMAALNSAPMSESDEFYAIHLSGGTCEILDVKRCGMGFSSQIIGQTLDINAGQFIDRIGVMLGLGFPCGKELDKLAQTTDEVLKYPVNVVGSNFNLSGAETKLKRELENGAEGAIVARSVFNCVADTLVKALENIFAENGVKNVIVSGGVASNTIIREKLEDKFDNVYFSNPKYATDNAVGIALLGMRSDTK